MTVVTEACEYKSIYSDLEFLNVNQRSKTHTVKIYLHGNHHWLDRSASTYGPRTLIQIEYMRELVLFIYRLGALPKL